jgi:hypothetical protein
LIFSIDNPVVLNLFDQLDQSLMSLISLKAEVVHENLHLIQEKVLNGLAVRFSLLNKVHSFRNPLFTHHRIGHLLPELLSFLRGHELNRLSVSGGLELLVSQEFREMVVDHHHSALMQQTVSAFDGLAALLVVVNCFVASCQNVGV